jgi:GxxExxY protein
MSPANHAKIREKKNAMRSWNQAKRFCVRCWDLWNHFRVRFGPLQIRKKLSELLYRSESYRIMGACFEVYKEKGNGFLEPVYHDCLEIELGMQGIPFRHEPDLPLAYKGIPLRRTYTPDFTCWDKIVIELKAASAITDEHVAQLLNYLNATGFRLGLIVNFGHYPGLESRRLVLNTAR